MVSTFQLYLKDYPDAPGIAQAEYWIGWAAFEDKKYQEAINPLLRARQLNPEEYAEKCSLRLIFSYQNLANKSDAAKEVDNFVQADPKKLGLVLDVCRWLGAEYYNNTNFDQAAKYLGLYVKNSQSEHIDKKILYSLAKSDVQIKSFQDALDVSNQFLAAAAEPADRAQGFLMLSKAQLGLQQFDTAIKSVEEALTLQPEGRLNAEARMQSGDIEVAKGDFNNAARSYMSVALLYEDPEVTPDALERAYEAFQKAGNEPQADKTLSELRSRFPNYQAKASAG
ncbi:MAG: tetratricopeptide repeat protein [Verrucomicrobia bacterium]|nr:tetratricopeptide repeat protein [Verrucomicrobiota bacterium]